MKNRLIDFENDFTEEEEAVFSTATEKAVPKENESLSLEDVVAKKYKLGMTIQQIRKDHGVSYGKVYEILTRKKVKLRNGRSRTKSNERINEMTTIDKKMLVKDYINGMPLAQIYKKYDINKYGCYTILDEENIPRRQNVGSLSDTILGPKAEAPTSKEINEEHSVEMKQQDDTLYIHIKVSKNNPIDNISLQLKMEE